MVDTIDAAGSGGTGRALGAAGLVVSGLLLALGGLLHPHVPSDLAAQMQVLDGNAGWLRSHWALTVAQPLGLVALFLFVDGFEERRRDAGLRGAKLLLGVGFLVGTLGTLSAATALPTAAGTGDLDLYGTVNAFALGLGWLCLALTSAGGLLLGVRLAGLAEGRGVQVTGWLVAGLSAPLLAATAYVSPSHPWTHDVILRASAVLVGLAMAGLGAWFGLQPPEGVP